METETDTDTETGAVGGAWTEMDTIGPVWLVWPGGPVRPGGARDSGA